MFRDRNFALLVTAAMLLTAKPFLLSRTCRGFSASKTVMNQKRPHHSSLYMDLSTSVVGVVMDSPLYKPIVNMARNTMVKTAESVGVDWKGYATKISSATDWEKRVAEVIAENPELPNTTPAYYKNRFHGYMDGNLCIEAAIEQELAGKAVGARNFPQEGANGEEKLRELLDSEVTTLGGSLSPSNRNQIDKKSSSPQEITVVDLGCGTGTSTRRLGKLYPSATSVIGFDLSPHMIAVGRFLQEAVPNTSNGLKWVAPIERDDRIELRYGDIASTGLPCNSASVVNLSLVLHELPREATEAIIKEAYRILKPGGVLSILEMDPDAPGYRKLRANPWLFAVLRSTEPYLDEYFDEVAPNLPQILAETGFPVVRIGAATGRHMAVVGLKAGVVDVRPADEVRAEADQHLNTLQREAR